MESLLLLLSLITALFTFLLLALRKDILKDGLSE